MPHPVIVIASFLTTIRTTWELSRMVRNRRAAQTLKIEAPRVYGTLQRAYHDGLLLEREFDCLLERLILSEASKDISALRKIQSDIRVILNKSSSQGRRREKS